MKINLLRLIEFALMALGITLLSACFESHYSDPYGYGYGYGPSYYEPAPVYGYAPEYVARPRAEVREEREEHEEHEEHEHHRPWHRDRD